MQKLVQNGDQWKRLLLNRLRQIFLKSGHVYVSKKGYVSIEVYSSDRMMCDYVARVLGGVAKRHMHIHKVVIHSRPALVTAARELLEVVYDDELEAQLRLVLEYATAATQKARSNAVEELRSMLAEEEE